MNRNVNKIFKEKKIAHTCDGDVCEDARRGRTIFFLMTMMMMMKKVLTIVCWHRKNKQLCMCA